jgi:hypothetical protein
MDILHHLLHLLLDHLHLLLLILGAYFMVLIGFLELGCGE